MQPSEKILHHILSNHYKKKFFSFSLRTVFQAHSTGAIEKPTSSEYCNVFSYIFNCISSYVSFHPCQVIPSSNGHGYAGIYLTEC